MDNRPIGIFDSGLGGLTAVKQINRLLPNENVIYFGDTGRVPYGTRSRETIIKYAQQDIDFLLSFDVKLVIAACGTVSSVFPEEKIKKLPVPYFGVVNSAAQAACSVNSNGRIGVIGTSSAVKSGAYGRAIRAIKPDTKVIGRPCPLFVPLVENGHFNTPVTKLVIEEYLEEIRAQGVDTLILGCTHYPLMKEAIREYMGDDVTLIDPGAEVALYLKKRLARDDAFGDKFNKKPYEYYVSDSVEGFSSLASIFLEKTIDGQVEKIDIERY